MQPEQVIDAPIPYGTAGMEASHPATVALQGGAYAVFWEELGRSTTTLHARMFDVKGQSYGNEVSLQFAGQVDNFRLAATSDNGFALAWSSGTTIFSQFFSRTGVAIDVAHAVGQIPIGGRETLSISLAEGDRAVLTWVNSGGLISETVDPHGILNGSRTVTTSNFGTGSATLAGGRSIILWGEVEYSQAYSQYSANGQIIDSNQQI